MDWNIVIAIISLLTLFVAVIIPIWQKNSHQKNSKRSFKMYLNKYFRELNFLLTEEKLGYYQYGGTEKYIFIDYLKKLEDDLENIKPSNLGEGMYFIQNFQVAMFRIYAIKKSIEKIKIDTLYDQTLKYGYFLTKKSVRRIYSILKALEKYVIKIEINDMFTDLKFGEIWKVNNHMVGIKFDSEKIGHWQEDVDMIIGNRRNFKEIIIICEYLYSTLKKK